MISYSLYNEEKTGARLNVKHQENKYIFDYPCTDPSSCTDYSITLSKGTFKFELYGASGGTYIDYVSSYLDSNKNCLSDSFVAVFNGNTHCHTDTSLGGSGGYVSGIINISKQIQIYATIGGQGQYKTISLPQYSTSNSFVKSNMVPGGYGGGGSSSAWTTGTASGGGQTAVKFEQNNLWHRVIVSGGGGGADDKAIDDGSGGSGGNLISQGWWVNGVYNGNFLAKSDSGFTFGQGEAAVPTNCKNPNGVQTSSMDDIAGAGGGWFGGFSSHDPSGGAGGGSSWALTKDAIIPSGLIEARDEFYENPEKHNYAFSKSSGYLFYDVQHAPGIWQGNGKLIISGTINKF